MKKFRVRRVMAKAGRYGQHGCPYLPPIPPKLTGGIFRTKWYVSCPQLLKCDSSIEHCVNSRNTCYIMCFLRTLWFLPPYSLRSKLINIIVIFSRLNHVYQQVPPGASLFDYPSVRIVHCYGSWCCLHLFPQLPRAPKKNLFEPHFFNL